jgi:hypothetical protein
MHEYDDDRTYQKFVLNYSSLASSRSRRRALDAVVSTVRLGLLAGAQKSVMVLLKKEVTKVWRIVVHFPRQKGGIDRD